MPRRAYDQNCPPDLRSEDRDRLACREPRGGGDRARHGRQTLPGLPREGDDPRGLQRWRGSPLAVAPEVASRLPAEARHILWYAVSAPAGADVGLEPVTLAIFGMVPPGLADQLPFSPRFRASLQLMVNRAFKRPRADGSP